MTADDLTPAGSLLAGHRYQAIAVLVAAETAQPDRRPVRESNHTSRPGAVAYKEMLTVHWAIADQLVAAGLVRVTNDVLRTLELTEAGRQLAREAGLG